MPAQSAHSRRGADHEQDALLMSLLYCTVLNGLTGVRHESVLSQKPHTEPRCANLVVIEGLGGLHDSLHNFGKVTGVEEVVGLGRSGQQLLGHSSVHLNAALADLVSKRLHDVIKVYQLEVEQAAKNALQLCIIW